LMGKERGQIVINIRNSCKERNMIIKRIRDSY
jgi:hypothetical protein